MKALMITGDRTFTAGNVRYDLMARTAGSLEVLYWGRGAWWPTPKDRRYDVVTTQDPFMRGLVGWYWARRTHARFNVQVHADLYAQSPLRHLLAQVVLRHADSIRVVSGRIRDQVVSMRVRAPITVLPVYLDLARFRTLPRRSDGTTILWVGRLEREKDPLLAIEVLCAVRVAGTDAKMVMLGSGSMARQVRRAARGLPVEMPGWQDPARCLPQSDVVLCTSPAESYGASMLEALAAGVPVVAPDIGVAKEAGATVVARHDLAVAVAEALHSRARGALKLNLLAEDEWAREWLRTLS